MQSSRNNDGGNFPYSGACLDAAIRFQFQVPWISKENQAVLATSSLKVGWDLSPVAQHCHEEWELYRVKFIKMSFFQDDHITGFVL